MTLGIRVVVTGSRISEDPDAVSLALDAFHALYPIYLLAHGDCAGRYLNGVFFESTDRVCRDWALENEVVPEPYPADWDTHGLSAGPRRNRQMLKEVLPEVVLVFPGGKGTANCRLEALKLGVPVFDVNLREYEVPF